MSSTIEIIKFSAVPVGHDFYLKGLGYTKSNHGRAYQNGKMSCYIIKEKIYITIKKHVLVEYDRNQNKRDRKPIKKFKI